MPDLTLYLTFVLLSAGIIVLPGPNVLLIVATSLSAGRRAGLVTVAGTSSAMAVQLLVAGVGTTALATLLADAFVWVKWLGVAYLAWLGLKHLHAATRDAPEAAPGTDVHRSYWQGFLVSLTNPKTILFFGAFLPQFVSPTSPPGLQIAVLSATFLVLAMVLDSVYAIGASSISRLVKHPGYLAGRNLAIGLLYLGASAGLAFTRRTGS